MYMCRVKFMSACCKTFIFPSISLSHSPSEAPKETFNDVILCAHNCTIQVLTIFFCMFQNFNELWWASAYEKNCSFPNILQQNNFFAFYLKSCWKKSCKNEWSKNKKEVMVFLLHHLFINICHINAATFIISIIIKRSTYFAKAL
jgi:hypothetical protein